MAWVATPIITGAIIENVKIREILPHCYKHCENCKIGSHYQCTSRYCECDLSIHATFD